MALINPSNLYSGGQGILRDDVVNFVANQEAKKAARDEAANQYFTKLVDTINPAGVRDVDQPYINQKLAELKGNWLQNKSAIKKGGLPQQDFSKQINGIRQEIERSKKRGELELTLGKAKFEGKFRPREIDFQIQQRVGLPINDPRSRKDDGVSEFGLEDFSIAAKPFGPRDVMTFKKAAIGDNKPQYDPATGAVKMDDSGKILVTKRFKPETVKAIGEQAGNLLKGSKSAEYFFEDLLDDPNEVTKATAALKKIYGDKMPDGSSTLADTPQKMAMGYMINEAANTAVEEEETDEALRAQRKRELQAQRDAASMARTKYKEQQRNARTKMLTQYNIDDVYQKVTDRPTKEITGPTGFRWRLKDVTDLTLEQKEDLFGVEKTPGGFKGYKYKPIELEGRMYVEVNDDDELIDKDQNRIDGVQVLTNTLKRTGKLEKPLGKGELKPVVKNKQSTKNKISW